MTNSQVREKVNWQKLKALNRDSEKTESKKRAERSKTKRSKTMIHLRW